MPGDPRSEATTTGRELLPPGAGEQQRQRERADVEPHRDDAEMLGKSFGAAHDERYARQEGEKSNYNHGQVCSRRRHRGVRVPELKALLGSRFALPEEMHIANLKAAGGMETIFPSRRWGLLCFRNASGLSYWLHNISPLAGGECALKFDYTLERAFSLNSKIVSSWKKLFRSGPQ